jgi:hypothetical protein
MIHTDKIVVGKPEGKKTAAIHGVDRIIILKWILKRNGVLIARIWLILFVIRLNVELL